jgi:peroxiredoxin
MPLLSLLLPLGTPLIPFSLPDPNGKIHSSDEFRDRKVLVVMFICNHCPYVQAVRQRLIDLQAGYDPRDMQLIGINANDWAQYPDDSPEEMKKAIQELGINFPYLYDESQQIAKAYSAQCTPDIFVFDQERKLAYHGRIDDNWKEADKVTRHELKEAIDALLRGEKPPEPQHPCMGCSIKWRTEV